VPLVAQLKPIIIYEEVYFLIFFMLCLPVIIYWGYQQYKNKEQQYTTVQLFY